MKRSHTTDHHEVACTKARKLTTRRGLFSLPRELRDQIYGFALVSTEQISVLNFAELPKYHAPKQKHGLSYALLATNRQVYNEAIGVLYGLNTFQAKIPMHLHQALRRREVEKALDTLRLPFGTDLPEPEVYCLTDRPRYSHPGISRIERLEVQLVQVVPDRPHWQDGGINVDHAMQDLCEAFVERNNLSLFILTTDGCASPDRWLAAAGGCHRFARGLDILMWQYHEWHFERALLAATRQKGFFWLNGDEKHDRISLEGPSTFHGSMRTSNYASLAKLRSCRHLPAHMRRTGQLNLLMSRSSR